MAQYKISFREYVTNGWETTIEANNADEARELFYEDPFAEAVLDYSDTETLEILEITVEEDDADQD